MSRINVFVNNRKLEAELNNTETAKKIYQSLPIKSEGSFWGNEIYFEIPLRLENEKPTEDIRVGDLAYWPEGCSLCIFYGKTPASTNDAPKPASPITLVGRVRGDLEGLKKIHQAKIKITKAQ